MSVSLNSRPCFLHNYIVCGLTWFKWEKPDLLHDYVMLYICKSQLYYRWWHVSLQPLNTNKWHFFLARSLQGHGQIDCLEGLVPVQPPNHCPPFPFHSLSPPDQWDYVYVYMYIYIHYGPKCSSSMPYMYYSGIVGTFLAFTVHVHVYIHMLAVYTHCWAVGWLVLLYYTQFTYM